MVQAFRIAMQDLPRENPNVIVEANGSLGELIRFLNFEIKKEQDFRGNSSIVNAI